MAVAAASRAEITYKARGRRSSKEGDASIRLRIAERSDGRGVEMTNGRAASPIMYSRSDAITTYKSVRVLTRPNEKKISCGHWDSGEPEIKVSKSSKSVSKAYRSGR